MTDYFCRLPERAVFDITGPDAVTYLQGIVTADVAALDPGEATHCGLLTPQGKILFDFFVLRTGDGFFVDCSTAQRDGLVQRLMMYKLRADVAIKARDDLGVGVRTDQPSDQPFAYLDPRLSDIGWRLVAPVDALPQNVDDEMAYHARRIALGLADTDADIRSGETFPHEANFDQQGAVSFKKGCYVGQEVVSRMQHRGTARARIVPISFDGTLADDERELKVDGKRIGQVLSAVEGHGLALVRLDRAQRAKDDDLPIETGGVPVTVLKPDWATYDIEAKK